MLMVPVAKYMEKISRCPNKHARKRTVKEKRLLTPVLHSVTLTQHSTKKEFKEDK